MLWVSLRFRLFEGDGISRVAAGLAEVAREIRIGACIVRMRGLAEGFLTEPEDAPVPKGI